MTIAKTAYDTFIGRPMVTTKARLGCEDTQHSSGTLSNNYYDYLNLPVETGENKEVVYTGALVTHGTPAEALIPPFVYPMIVNDPASFGKPGTGAERKFLVGDARPFMRAQRDSAEPCRVINAMEFELLRVLLAAGMHWLTSGPQHLMGISPVLAQVYCRWLADTISRRFELDLTQRQVARVIAAYFFQCCFSDAKDVPEQQKRAMVAQACRAAGVPLNDFEHVLSDVDSIDSVEDFVAVLQNQLSTPRLDNFNVGVLAQIMMGTWFGFNGRELAVAAIEHPPTFAAMLYMSFAQNSYRKAGLAQVSEAFKGSRGGAEFVRNMQLQLKLR